MITVFRIRGKFPLGFIIRQMPDTGRKYIQCGSQSDSNHTRLLYADLGLAQSEWSQHRPTDICVKPISLPMAKTTSRRGDDVTKWHNTHTHPYWVCRHVWSSDHNTDFLLNFAPRKKTELIYTGQLPALPTDREGCMWHTAGVPTCAILRVYITHLW